MLSLAGLVQCEYCLAMALCRVEVTAQIEAGGSIDITITAKEPPTGWTMRLNAMYYCPAHMGRV